MRLMSNPVSCGLVKSAVKFVTGVAFVGSTILTGLFVISVMSRLE